MCVYQTNKRRETDRDREKYIHIYTYGERESERGIQRKKAIDVFLHRMYMCKAWPEPTADPRYVDSEQLTKCNLCNAIFAITV